MEGFGMPWRVEYIFLYVYIGTLVPEGGCEAMISFFF